MNREKATICGRPAAQWLLLRLFVWSLIAMVILGTVLAAHWHHALPL